MGSKDKIKNGAGGGGEGVGESLADFSLKSADCNVCHFFQWHFPPTLPSPALGIKEQLWE